MEDNTLLPRLEAIVGRFEEVELSLSDPAVVSDMSRFKKLNKEYKDLQALVNAYHTYRSVLTNIDSAKEVLYSEEDDDFKQMARQELDEMLAKKETLEEEVRIMLIPKDPEDERNAVLEIRAGTGGDEASIFAGDLFRMYTRYCESKGFKIQIDDFKVLFLN